MEGYEKIRSVGRGAHGTVYLCRRKSDDAKVIIKEIPVEEMTTEERQVAINEVNVLRRFNNHPNIIGYYDNFVEEKALMIVMEYAEGGTVSDYLEKKAKKNIFLNDDEILRLFAQIVLALHCVHKKRILHRDLKTQNILLDKKGKIVKIGDFGISKILSSKISKAYSVIGTPCYLSPELCEGKPYNQKSDIWALGCVLYELVTLKRAFEAPTLPAVVLKIMRGNFNPIPERCSDELRTLIQSLLHLKPDKRPSVVELMAHPVLVNALFDLQTDVGRVPCSQPPIRQAGIAAAIPPSRSKTSSGATKVFRTMSVNSTSTTMSDIQDNLGSLKGPQHVVFHWGGGISIPVELPLPQNDTDVVQVSSGRALKAGVTEKGRMVIWESSKNAVTSSVGRNAGNLWLPRLLEGQSGIVIVQVSCGDLFAACLTDRGILMTFGSGTHGCLGHGNTNDVCQAKIVEALLGEEVKQVSCGASHVMVVTADDDLFSWGRGDNGRLALGNQDTHPYPRPIALKENYQGCSVHCGIDCSFLLTGEKMLLACGSNRCNKLALDREGQTFDDSTVFLPIAAEPLASESINSVAMGTSHTAVITSKNQCYTFGSNSFGQLGYHREGALREPQMVTALEGKNLTAVACGDTFTVTVSSENEVFVWGKGSRGRLGLGSEEDSPVPKCVSMPAEISVLSVSSSHSGTIICGTKRDSWKY